ncbi:MAG: aspartate carbamoyltransferase regulatory subunit [Firmicutes bacterium]|nr:aspartate carbamoyltransferase regulatory subunit [Bacillota bacterium]MBQ2455344.1 aspartate carbamoyltransferase regulatory subunit [Bacillota bacterium]MBQ3578128.1 aspartate carbamoyltransferase regulatory subunit [Bacillota bacterium]MBQ4181121.1 aspartate carbamoyltransferase regulatory subunit [Bacillota bacterium]MBQ4234105.1 aspartate carbamoyltransferase regulatory subunit [Bacillota bacterium]
MNIEPIVNGVVIDHITAGQGMRLYELLGLDKLDCSVAVIKNAMGKRGLRKDIIKIDQEIDLDLDVIGYADPGVTVNFIKDGKVAEKRTIDMPEKLVDVIKCRNPRCITGTEQELRHIFILTDRKNKVYRCMYCETQA